MSHANQIYEHECNLICRYNGAVCHKPAARITIRAAGGDPWVVLIGNSRRLWNTFLAACASQQHLDHNHPLENYIESCITTAVQKCVGDHSYRLYWSHQPAPDLEGGAGYVGMQRMASVAGLAYLCEVSHLCMHPTYGPWFSLRAAVVFDSMLCPPGTVAAPPPLTNPLDEAAQARVAAAMKEALEASNSSTDDGSTVSFANVRPAWKKWLAVRDAAYPQHPWRYDEVQTTYHYTGDRQLLKQEAEKLRQEGYKETS